MFLAQKLNGKPFTVVGDGTQRRDFVFVTDLARAFLAAAESARRRDVYNVGAGNPQPVNRLVELLAGDVVHLPKRPGEPDCTWADITKIRARTRMGAEGFVSRPALREMLRRIDYWREAPVWDAASIEQATRTWFTMLSGERT